MSTSRRWLTPGKISAAVALLVLAFAIFLPQQSDTTDIALSSHSAGPNGARALYDVLHRFGYPVQRGNTSMRHPLDSTSTYVLLQPSIPVTAVEQNMLLDAVRRGATLILTAQMRPLSDSLGFEVRPALGRFRTVASTQVAGDDSPFQRDAELIVPLPITTIVALQDSVRSDTATFMSLSDPPNGSQNGRQPVGALVLGRIFGKGHAIAVAPSALLTNQFVRDGRPAVAIVHALDWATSSHSARAVIFDEYHHGFGAHADLVGTVRRALTSTSLGRMTLQIVVAAMILILAVGARAIPPVAAPTVTRRSPLEHVGALARAYLQVDSSQLGADRLVRGLRRRHPLGVARSVPHRTYLSTLRARVPAAAQDVDLIIAALEHDPHSANGITAVGTAAAHIERTLQA